MLRQFDVSVVEQTIFFVNNEIKLFSLANKLPTEDGGGAIGDGSSA